MKKVLYCPFCSRIAGIKQYHRAHNLHTMGNADYVYFVCDGCKREFWILETDFDKLGEEREE